MLHGVRSSCRFIAVIFLEPLKSRALDVSAMLSWISIPSPVGIISVLGIRRALTPQLRLKKCQANTSPTAPDDGIMSQERKPGSNKKVMLMDELILPQEKTGHDGIA